MPALALATGAGSGAITAGLIEQLEADATQREARAKAGFEQFCADTGLTVPGAPAEQPAGARRRNGTSKPAGSPIGWRLTAAASDLVVASRSVDEALGRSTLEAVLLETGRPLLIPGPAAMPAAVERIAIAWKPVPQAARAVALAMPFLQRASEVIIATVEESAEDGDEIARLSRYLEWHGLHSTVARMRPGPDGAAATLLSAIAGRADLLVMGGYGHSRVREWVFGGFTTHVLADAPLPVLMAH